MELDTTMKSLFSKLPQVCKVDSLITFSCHQV